MKRLLLGGLTAAGVLLGGLALTSAGVSATTTNTNDAAYWQKEGTTCIKHDVGSGDFADSSSDGSAVTLKAPAVLLVVKGGAEDTGDGPGNAVYDNLVVGTLYRPPSNNGGETAGVSHWIVCTSDTPTTDTPPVEVAAAVVYTVPTCAAAGTGTPEAKTGLTWTTNPDGSFTATATTGYVLVGTSTFPALLPKLTGASCLSDSTPAVPPRIEVGGPVPPTAAPTAPPAAPSPESAVSVAAAAPAAPAAVSPTMTELPSTGSSSWTLFFAGLASLMGGLGLTKLSRRPS